MQKHFKLQQKQYTSFLDSSQKKTSFPLLRYRHGQAKLVIEKLRYSKKTYESEYVINRGEIRIFMTSHMTLSPLFSMTDGQNKGYVVYFLNQSLKAA